MEFQNLRITLATVVVALAAAGFAESKTYKIDSVHSTVIFKVLHMNAGNAYGRFNVLEGEVAHDEAAPEKSTVNFKVKADSIDTANAKRDEHLKGPDFLNVAEFPEITFKSTEVKKAGEKEFELKGDLTLHGVTKPITAKLVQVGSVPDPRAGGTRAGAEATFTIKRSDFGMNYMPQALGDNIDVIVSTEAIAK